MPLTIPPPLRLPDRHTSPALVRGRRLLVAPARILFRLRDHTIVCGFGTKGRNPEDHRPEETT